LVKISLSFLWNKEQGKELWGKKKHETGVKAFILSTRNTLRKLQRLSNNEIEISAISVQIVSNHGSAKKKHFPNL